MIVRLLRQYQLEQQQYSLQSEHLHSLNNTSAKSTTYENKKEATGEELNDRQQQAVRYQKHEKAVSMFHNQSNSRFTDENDVIFLSSPNAENEGHSAAFLDDCNTKKLPRTKQQRYKQEKRLNNEELTQKSVCENEDFECRKSLLKENNKHFGVKKKRRSNFSSSFHRWSPSIIGKHTKVEPKTRCKNKQQRKRKSSAYLLTQPCKSIVAETRSDIEMVGKEGILIEEINDSKTPAVEGEKMPASALQNGNKEVEQRDSGSKEMGCSPPKMVRNTDSKENGEDAANKREEKAGGGRSSVDMDEIFKSVLTGTFNGTNETTYNNKTQRQQKRPTTKGTHSLGFLFPNVKQRRSL